MLHSVWQWPLHAILYLQDAGPNHYWISGTDVPYKFELGGPAHEGCAGIVALADYLSLMASSGMLLLYAYDLSGSMCSLPQ